MVRKFRSIEEMNAYQEANLRLETDPHRIAQRAAALFEIAHLFCPGRFRGVHKFRTVEESNDFRLQWTRERVERLARVPARPDPLEDGER